MDCLPFSVSQERHLLSEEYRARSGSPPSVSNFVDCRRLHGRLDMAALVGAIRRLIHQRTSLRVGVVPDAAYSADERRTQVERFAKTGLFPPRLYRQVLVDTTAVPLDVRDVSSLSEGQRTELLDNLWFEEAVSPFDLTKPPLIRVTLLRAGDDDHLLIVALPHYAADAQSVEICCHDLLDTYERLANGDGVPAVVPDTRFYELLSDARQRFDRGLLDDSVTYWRDVWSRPEELGGRISDLDFARRSSAAVVGSRSQKAPLDADTFERLQALRRELRVSAAAILLAALARLLQRHGDLQTIAPWVPLANRIRPGAASTVGWLATAHVVPVTVAPDAEGVTAMKLCHRALVNMMCHQELPLQWMWERQGKVAQRHTRVIFNYFKTQPEQPLASLRVERIRGAERYSLTDGLDVRVIENPRGLVVHLFHSVGRFSDEAISVVLDEYIRIVKMLVWEPTAALLRA